MTNALRKSIARRLLYLLNKGVHRKLAIIKISEEFSVSRRSIYRYCKRFGVSTK